jgi:hypothetical protein
MPVASGGWTQRSAIRNRLAVVAATAAVAGLGAILNWPDGMDAEVVGGLVFLVGTVLGVEWFVAQNNERERAQQLRERWAGLGGVPFRGLSGPVGDIVDGLAWLLTTHHPFERPTGVSDRLAAQLPDAIGRSRLKPTNIPTREQHALFEQRLTPLLEDEEWCALAGKVIDLLKWGYRERIGIWAGPMLDHPDVARVLKRMTLLDDRIGELQAPLRELARLPHEDTDVDPEIARRRWFSLLGECVSLREDLQRAALAGDQSYQSAIHALKGFARHRQWAQPSDLNTMEQRAAWAFAPLRSGNTAAWQKRRERVLATPLADTPAEWKMATPPGRQP